MKVGVFPGKFLPPHRGHLTGILRAHALCDQLYVVISEQPDSDGLLCRQAGIRYISGQQRARWLAQELKGLQIEIILLDEQHIPVFPDGWAEYADLLRSTINQPIDLIFGGETSYIEGHHRHFPGVEYHILDPERSTWSVSGTAIRQNPYKYWDYIVEAARPFFAKRILITGPESCGKTTLTHKLAKAFATSWSEELGRVYQEAHIGSTGNLFDLEDFNRIAHLQYEQDLRALAVANRVCFFDTDAVVTRFFSEFFIGSIADRIERFIDPAKYDLVFALKPTVPWIDDGMRDTNDQLVRNGNFEKLIQLYQQYGFDLQKFIIVESPDYYERFELCIREVERLLHASTMPDIGEISFSAAPSGDH